MTHTKIDANSQIYLYCLPLISPQKECNIDLLLSFMNLILLLASCLLRCSVVAMLDR